MTCDMDCIYRDAAGVCTISPALDTVSAAYCTIGVSRSWVSQETQTLTSYAPNGMGREGED